jgi:hypothetical protein
MMFGKKAPTEDESHHEVSATHEAVVNVKPSVLNYVAAIFAYENSLNIMKEGS